MFPGRSRIGIGGHLRHAQGDVRKRGNPVDMSANLVKLRLVSFARNGCGQHFVPLKSHARSPDARNPAGHSGAHHERWVCTLALTYTTIAHRNAAVPRRGKCCGRSTDANRQDRSCRCNRPPVDTSGMSSRHPFGRPPWVSSRMRRRTPPRIRVRKPSQRRPSMCRPVTGERQRKATGLTGRG